MFVGVVVVAGRLGRIGVVGPILPVVVGVLMVAWMLAMQVVALQDIANPDPRRAGGVERDDESQQEGEQEPHGANSS